MDKTKISNLIMIFVLMGCSGFPYQGVIKESSRFVSETYPEIFKELEWKGEKFKYLSLGNTQKDILIFIHGSPGSWKSWAHFYKDERLLNDFEVITFSRLGFGDNRPGIPEKSLAMQSLIPRLIIDEKRKINPNRKVIVVGHSYGGPVAVKMAASFPEYVDAILLIAASVDPDLEKEEWYQKIGKLWGIRHLIPDLLDVTNREIIALKGELSVLAKEFSSLEKPVSIIHGVDDKLVPIANVDFMRKKLIGKQNISYQIIKNMKHFVPWSFPQAITNNVYRLSELLQKEKK